MKKCFDFPQKTWIRGGAALIVALAMVIWIGNYWLLLGLPIVFDIYFTKKVPWEFWKNTKDGKPLTGVASWIDAILFALVAVYFINLFFFQNYKIPTSSLEKSLLVGDHLFVSKMSYGPRMPNTPIGFPLVQNTFPITNTKSYFEWPNWDYKRLAGFGDVKRGDIVVFNFPAGDTVAFNVPNPDFYSIILGEGSNYLNQNPNLAFGKKFTNEFEVKQFVSGLGREVVKRNSNFYGEVVYRPVDRRDNYVKRCVALPGDTFEIRDNQIFIDGNAVNKPKYLQHYYRVITDGTPLNSEFLDRIEMSQADRDGIGYEPNYTLALTQEKVDMIKQMSFIKSVTLVTTPRDSSGSPSVFPQSRSYPWSRDNYGPLWMPKAGVTVTLDMKNIMLYDRIITAYEGNKLEVKNGVIFINGKETTSYTFKMNYYFMLGDNRHQSADSRYWGFVPEDHIVGKPILVWLSLDADKSFPFNIRWDRFFTFVKTE